MLKAVLNRFRMAGWYTQIAIGKNAVTTRIKLEGATPGSNQRFILAVKNREVTVKRNDEETQRLTLPADAPARGALGLRDTGGVVEFMNLYARDF